MLAASHLLRRNGIDVDIVCVARELTLAPQHASAEGAGASHVQRSYKERLASSAKRTLQDAQRILAHTHEDTRPS
jgi:hypothetical protein